MAKYMTPDGVEVEATEQVSEPNEFGETTTIWEIEFPDGEVRYCHENSFADNFEEVS